MAYLHCHKCGWSQDDFWDFLPSKWFWRRSRKIRFGYNPISYYLGTVFGEHGNIKPRRVNYDSHWADEMGWKRSDPYSWWLIWFNFKKMITTFKKQKYFSWKQYKNSSKRCPGCNVTGLCVD